jgi:FkbM family methyltransferase
MDEVGESSVRNREFQSKFSRESIIRKLIDERVEAPVLLDVGAHKGESVRYLRKLFPNSTIHSFEPSSNSFAQLQLVRDERTHCYNVALTDVDGGIDFFENKISHTNSVFRVNEASRDSLYLEKNRRKCAEIPAGTFNLRQQVPSMRLETFCEREGIRHVDLLKIDVQGAESKVLTGAAHALAFTDTIILEIMFFDYYEHQGSFLEIESVLQPYGFRIFAISDISNNPMNGRTDWVEAIYRKTSLR